VSKAVAGCVPGVVLTAVAIDIPADEGHHGCLRDRDLNAWARLPGWARLHDCPGDSGSLDVKRQMGTVPGQLADLHDDEVVSVDRLRARQRDDPLSADGLTCLKSWSDNTACCSGDAGEILACEESGCR
jgi:hypothetical protein